MSDKLVLKCSDFNVTKVSGCDGFRRRLRVNNGECKFYEIVASNERVFRFGDVYDCFGVIDDK